MRRSPFSLRFGEFASLSKVPDSGPGSLPSLTRPLAPPACPCRQRSPDLGPLGPVTYGMVVIHPGLGDHLALGLVSYPN